MRRALLVAVLGLLLLSRAATAGDDPRGVAAESVLTLNGEEIGAVRPPTFFAHERDDYAGLGAFADPRWEAFVRALPGAPVRLVATAFRVTHSGGAAAPILRGDDVLLDAGAEDQLRAALRAGDLVPIGRVATVGRPGEPLQGRDRDESRVAAAYDVEAAIGVSCTYPLIEVVGGGLEFAACIAPHVDGAYMVAFTASLVGAARTHDVPSFAGPRADVRAPAFAVSGAALLRPGETTYARGVDAAGDGFLLVVRATGPEAVRLPVAVGEGRVALPTAALCHAPPCGSLPSDIGFPPAETDGPGRLAPWSAGDGDERADADLATVLVRAGVPFEEEIAHVGAVSLVRVPPGSDRLALGAIQEVLARHVTCALVVESPGGARVVLPFVDGGAPSAFLGEVATRTAGLDVETGCDTCMGSPEYVEHDVRGLAVVLNSAPGVAAELHVTERAVASETSRLFPVRRTLPGHASFVHDIESFDFRSDDELHVRSLVPHGGGDVAGGFAVSVRGRAPLRTDPTRLDVDGGALYATPGTAVRLRHVRTTPHVVDWGWDGSCGMTLRYPEVAAIRSGRDVALVHAEHMSVLTVAGEIDGMPRTLEPAFDMGDGEVEVLAVPHISLETSLPLGAVRRIAWSGDLELRVGAPGVAARPPLRTVTVGGVGLRYAEGAAVILDAGDRTRLPADIGHYTSNHDSGEAWTRTAVMSSGVALVLAPSRGGVARGFADLRGDPARRTFELRKFQAPRRPDTSVNLSLPSRTRRTVPLAVADGRALELAFGLDPSVRIAVGPPAVEEDK